MVGIWRSQTRFWEAELLQHALRLSELEASPWGDDLVFMCCLELFLGWKRLESPWSGIFLSPSFKGRNFTRGWPFKDQSLTQWWNFFSKRSLVDERAVGRHVGRFQGTNFTERLERGIGSNKILQLKHLSFFGWQLDSHGGDWFENSGWKDCCNSSEWYWRRGGGGGGGCSLLLLLLLLLLMLMLMLLLFLLFWGCVILGEPLLARGDSTISHNYSDLFLTSGASFDSCPVVPC